MENEAPPAEASAGFQCLKPRRGVPARQQPRHGQLGCVSVWKSVSGRGKRNHRLPELDSVTHSLTALLFLAKTYETFHHSIFRSSGVEGGQAECNFHISEGNTGGLE